MQHNCQSIVCLIARHVWIVTQHVCLYTVLKAVQWSCCWPCLAWCGWSSLLLVSGDKKMAGWSTDTLQNADLIMRLEQYDREVEEARNAYVNNSVPANGDKLREVWRETLVSRERLEVRFLNASGTHPRFSLKWMSESPVCRDLRS